MPEADIEEVLDNRYTDIPETQISVENRYCSCINYWHSDISELGCSSKKKKDLIGAQISIENYNDTVHADTCVSILITDISRY